jgi:hypothetical protein
VTLLRFLDVCALIAAALASYLWFYAGWRSVRRVSKHEEFDHADLNRVVVAFNRSNLLNRRAALASGVSALFVASRMLVDLLR